MLLQKRSNSVNLTFVIIKIHHGTAALIFGKLPADVYNDEN